MTRTPSEVFAREIRATESSGRSELSAWDDFGIHQSAALLADVTPAVPGWAERFYFNMLRPSGELLAILGAGLYLNRGVSEAYFCHFEGQTQRNARSAWRLPISGADSDAVPPPLQLTCDRPLSDWRVEARGEATHVDAHFHGLCSPYLYDLVDIPADEVDGPFDLLRHFVQVGTWEVADGTSEMRGESLVGVRDRTWGVRSRRVRFHCWMVLTFGARCVTVMHHEAADGATVLSEAGIVDESGHQTRLEVSAHDFTFDSNTREMIRGSMRLSDRSIPSDELELSWERVGLGLRLAGAGYDASQGSREDAAEPQSDSYDLADPEVAASTGRGTIDHGVQARAKGIWDADGIGVVETAIARNHVGYGSQIA